MSSFPSKLSGKLSFKNFKVFDIFKLSDYKIRTKLLLSFSVALFALACVTGYSLYDSRSDLLERRKDKAKNLTEVAYGTVEGYYQLAKKGVMTEEAAQTAAKDTLRSMRYAKKDYFWVNDINSNLVVHPIRKDREGTNALDIKDANGKILYKEFVDIAKANPDGGYIAYDQLRPDKKAKTPKMSYVKLHAGWGWVIGTGLYIADLNVVFFRLLTHLVIAVSVLGILLSILMLRVAKSISDPIKLVSENLFEIAQGQIDFNKRIKYKGRNEIGHMAYCFNAFIEDLESKVEGITTTSNSVTRVVSQLSATSEMVKGVNSAQSNVIRSSSDSIGQIATSIQVIVNDITLLAGISKRLRGVAGQISTSTVEVTSISAEIEKLSATTIDITTGFVIAIDRLNDNLKQLTMFVDDTETLSAEICNAVHEVDTEMRRHANFASKTHDTLENLAEQQLGHITKNVKQSQAEAKAALDSLQYVYSQMNSVDEFKSEEIQKKFKNAAGWLNHIQEMLTEVQYPLKNTSDAINKIFITSSESVQIAMNLEKAFMHHILNIETNASTTKKMKVSSDIIQTAVKKQAEGLVDLQAGVKTLREISTSLQTIAIHHDKDTHMVLEGIAEIDELSTVILDETGKQQKESKLITDTLNGAVRTLETSRKTEVEFVSILGKLDTCTKSLQENLNTVSASVATPVAEEDIFAL